MLPEKRAEYSELAEFPMAMVAIGDILFDWSREKILRRGCRAEYETYGARYA